MSSRDAAEQTVRDIRRRTRKQYSAEEKIRIVLDGLRVRRQNIWDKCSCFLTEDLAHLSLQLNRLTLMFQAAVLDGEFFDFFASFR